MQSISYNLDSPLTPQKRQAKYFKTAEATQYIDTFSDISALFTEEEFTEDLQETEWDVEEEKVEPLSD